eukprot:4318946-Prymnesium_polylepis.1
MSFVEAPQAFCYDVMLTKILRKLRVVIPSSSTQYMYPINHTYKSCHTFNPSTWRIRVFSDRILSTLE